SSSSSNSSSSSSSSSSSFPLAQAQDEDGDEATEYGNLARAAGGYMEEADHLLSYHSSSSAADVDEVLMPELANATALDCGNFVDYDEFNLCLNNILSEEDDDSGSGGGGGGGGGGGLVRKPHHQQQQQTSWRDAGDMLNIVQLNNDLGLSFQEFASESTADEQRSANSSSPQLA
ncbi:hypothetical protein KR054_010719, partial [Drosophila jambulina]